MKLFVFELTVDDEVHQSVDFRLIFVCLSALSLGGGRVRARRCSHSDRATSQAVVVVVVVEPRTASENRRSRRRGRPEGLLSVSWKRTQAACSHGTLEYRERQSASRSQ